MNTEILTHSFALIVILTSLFVIHVMLVIISHTSTQSTEGTKEPTQVRRYDIKYCKDIKQKPYGIAIIAHYNDRRVGAKGDMTVEYQLRRYDTMQAVHDAMRDKDKSWWLNFTPSGKFDKWVWEIYKMEYYDSTHTPPKGHKK